MVRVRRGRPYVAHHPTALAAEPARSAARSAPDVSAEALPAPPDDPTSGSKASDASPNHQMPS